MSWATKRIQQYKEGKEFTWLERRVLDHANPAHLVMDTAGTVLLVYGLWIHGWLWIALGIILSFLGHLYSWIQK